MSNQNVTLSHRQILVIFSGLMMTMLLAILDQTIVATALPTIASDLGGVAHISWVPAAYLITTTLAAPLYGKISDLVGRKAIYQLAIVIFLVGSMACGLSRNMTELIAFRALQGLGGGGLMSLSFAIVGDVISPRARGRYQGYFSSLALVGTAVGPLAGGFFTQDLSWRWIFYINVPLGVGALVVTTAKLHLPRNLRRHEFDVTGAVLMVVTVSALLVTLVTGGSALAWSSPATLALLGVVVVGGAVLMRHEGRAAEPLFPPRVFLHPVSIVACVLTLFLAAAQFVAVIYLPVYLQLAKGVTPIASGLSMLPLVFATAVSSIFCGRMMTRSGRYKVFPVTAASLMLLGMVAFSRMDAQTSHLVISASMAVYGAGMGAGMQVLVTVIQNAVEARDIGIASSSLSFFRNIGASAGTAVFGTLLVSRLNFWLPLDVPSRHLDARSASSLANPTRLGTLPQGLRDGITQAFVHALQSVFVDAIPLLAAAVLVALALREIPLGSESAIDRSVVRRATADDP